MSRTSASPRFTEANKLFMYRLLRDRIGCGKQTFITRVEEELAQERLAAQDLGFDSTLQLLEELGPEVVKITLFKGGRAYATLLTREDWDKALAAPESKAPSKGNKPWKKKKGDKSLKPSCPKRVKTEKPQDVQKSVSPVAEDAQEQPTVAPDAAPCADGADETQTQPSSATSVETRAESKGPDARLRNAIFSFDGLEPSEPADCPEAVEPKSDEPETDGQPLDEAEADEKGAPEEGCSGSSPHIALTVTYDPYTGQKGESSLIATPEELARRAVEKAAAEAARRAAQEASAAAARAAQIARERRAAVIAAAIAERAAQKEAEAARELAEAEARARAEAEAEITELDPVDTCETCYQGEPVADDAAAAAAAAATDATVATDAMESPLSSQEPKTPAPSDERQGGAVAPATPCEPTAPQLPSDFPLDFSEEVFCPGPLLHELTLLYPYGADVMGIVSEYCLIARERGSIEASRSRATFSICFLKDGQRATANVVIRRRRDAGMGAAWAIDSLAVEDGDARDPE